MKTPRLLITIIAVLGLASFNISCGPNGKRGAVLGGAAGAGVGAIIGNQSGRAGEGALIGGAIGALGGAALGGARDDENAIRYNQGYNNGQGQNNGYNRPNNGYNGSNNGNYNNGGHNNGGHNHNHY